LDPVKRAFATALAADSKEFETDHSDLVASLFDVSFLEHEGAPVLAEFLRRDGRPDPTELCDSGLSVGRGSTEGAARPVAAVRIDISYRFHSRNSSKIPGGRWEA
jgi:hypothetical protein